MKLECTHLLLSGADESLHLREADNTKERQHGHHKPRGDRTPRTQTTTLLRSLELRLTTRLAQQKAANAENNSTLRLSVAPGFLLSSQVLRLPKAWPHQISPKAQCNSNCASHLCKHQSRLFHSLYVFTLVPPP